MWPFTKLRASVRIPITVEATFSTPVRDESDSIEVNTWLKSHPEVERWFWGIIAGVTHRNDDGSSRQKALRHCQPFELLTLVSEPDNPYDANAIRVLNAKGEQMGYLERRLASDTTKRIRKGQQWQAMFFALTGPKYSNGAKIVMLQMKKQNV